MKHEQNSREDNRAMDRGTNSERELFTKLKSSLEREVRGAPKQSTRRGFLQAIVVAGVGAAALTPLAFGANGECGSGDKCFDDHACKTNTCYGDNSCEDNKCETSNDCQASNYCSWNACDDVNTCNTGNLCSEPGNVCTDLNGCVSSNTCQELNTCNGNTCGTNTCRKKNSCTVNLCTGINTCTPLANICKLCNTMSNANKASSDPANWSKEYFSIF